MSMGNQNNGLADFGRLLELVASQNTGMLPSVSTLPVGISGATLGNVFNPETLLATGMFSPAAFQQAVDSTYNQMLADYQSQVARTMQVPFEATFESLSFNRDPAYAAGTEIGELMRDAIAGISSGTVTADQAIQQINAGISSGVVPAEVASSIGKIGEDLKNFQDKELPAYQKAVQKFEYDSAQAMANLGIAEPTRQDARLKFYSSIGMPQLALLPDPTEQYQIDEYFFSDPAQVKKLQGQVSAGEEKLASETARLAPQLAQEQGFIGRTKRLGNVMSSAAKAAEKAKQKYISENMPKDTRDFIGKALDFAGGSPIIGGLFGGNQRQQDINAVEKQAQNIYDQVFAQKFSERAAKPYITQGGKTAAQLSPAAKEAQKQKLIGEAQLRMLAAYNKPKIAQAQSQLAAAGLTPWQQAMNQLMMNAQSMSTKLNK